VCSHVPSGATALLISSSRSDTDARLRGVEIPPRLPGLRGAPSAPERMGRLCPSASVAHGSCPRFESSENRSTQPGRFLGLLPRRCHAGESSHPGQGHDVPVQRSISESSTLPLSLVRQASMHRWCSTFSRCFVVTVVEVGIRSEATQPHEQRARGYGRAAAVILSGEEGPEGRSKIGSRG
jgi:hypothetical protein